MEKVKTRKIKRLEPADYVIAAGVLVPITFDMVAWRRGWKTASVRFGEFLEDPKTRLLFAASWAAITFHLFLKLPLPGGKTLKTLSVKKVHFGDFRKLVKVRPIGSTNRN